MIYDKYLRVTEAERWRMETDIPWQEVQPELALTQPDILEKLRGAALIESYAPMFALKSLHLWWDSLEESAIASIQFYEEYKHYFALKRYLEPLGYGIPEREIVDVRRKNYGAYYEDRVRQLANYMMSEHFTAHFYQRLKEQAAEPVLKVLLDLLMRDEFRHCNVFYALLQRRLQQDPSIRGAIVEEALNFQHQGVEVVGEGLPVAEANDFEVILLFFKKVQGLTGVSLKELRKGMLQAASKGGLLLASKT
jgi:hypothetical protein